MTEYPPALIAEARKLAEKHGYDMTFGCTGRFRDMLCEALSTTLPSEEAMGDFIVCPGCGEATVNKTVCPKCGTYGERTPKPEPTEGHLRRACEELNDTMGSVGFYFPEYAETVSVRTVARLLAERDEVHAVVAEANNSLYGSQSFFLSTNGGPPDKYHLAHPIEDLKAAARKAHKLEAEREAMQARVESIARTARVILCENEEVLTSTVQRHVEVIAALAVPEPTPDPDLVLAREAERIMREFYVSREYDPKASRHADTVKAAIAFALKLKGQAHDQ